MNLVVIIGNAGRDPESKTTKGGSAVTNLSIATNERQKDKDGNWTDHTEWHRVVCFGKTAENVARFVKKGRQLSVRGRLRTSKWKDKDGNDRYTTEIIADEVMFLGGGSGGGAGGASGGSSDSSPSSGGGGGWGGDDEIPF